MKEIINLADLGEKESIHGRMEQFMKGNLLKVIGMVWEKLLPKNIYSFKASSLDKSQMEKA